MTQVRMSYDYNTIYGDCHASFMLGDASRILGSVSGGMGMPPYEVLRGRQRRHGDAALRRAEGTSAAA